MNLELLAICLAVGVFALLGLLALAAIAYMRCAKGLAVSFYSGHSLLDLLYYAVQASWEPCLRSRRFIWCIVW